MNQFDRTQWLLISYHVTSSGSDDDSPVVVAPEVDPPVAIEPHVPELYFSAEEPGSSSEFSSLTSETPEDVFHSAEEPGTEF